MADLESSATVGEQSSAGIKRVSFGSATGANSTPAMPEHDFCAGVSRGRSGSEKKALVNTSPASIAWNEKADVMENQGQVRMGLF